MLHDMLGVASTNLGKSLGVGAGIRGPGPGSAGGGRGTPRPGPLGLDVEHGTLGQMSNTESG